MTHVINECVDRDLSRHIGLKSGLPRNGLVMPEPAMGKVRCGEDLRASRVFSEADGVRCICPQLAPGVGASLFGQRDKQFRQLDRQGFNFVDDGVLFAENVRHIFIRFRVEVDAVAVDALLV